MKHFVSLSLLLVSYLSVAQIGTHPLPERKDNQVLIFTADPDSVAFQKVLNSLAENEWFVDQSDPQHFLIRTKTRPVKSLYSAQVYLTISKSKTQPAIAISGYFDAGQVMGVHQMGPVEFVGSAGAVPKQSFALMQAVAKAYADPQAQIFYDHP